MARDFKCSRCGCYLGELIKGKIKKNTALLCEECMDFYKTCDSLAQYNKGKGLGKGLENLGNLGDIFKEFQK